MDKLNELTAAAQYDLCGCGGKGSAAPAPLSFIHRAALPGGGCIPLLKVLMTNVCLNDCSYCVNQIGRDIPRCSFQAEELAKLFMELHARRLVQGLFLSSGTGNDTSRTMESMITAVEILRQRYGFRGYVHLKILPGARFDCVEAACKLADRVSLNIEAPTVHHLARLSHKKDLHHGILERMGWVKRLIAGDGSAVSSGQTSQFVVGAAEETDRDILHTATALYHDMGLRRVYFSAFRPITNSPLEDRQPTPPIREHRLYQTDWLFRVYGFSLSEMELALGQNDNFPLGKDPKLSIAQKQPWLFPVDVNTAAYRELLRVPGIGPTSAKRIIEARRGHSISSRQQLEKMRVVTGRAIPFIRFKGMLDHEKQTSFLPWLDEQAHQPAVPFP